MKALLIAGAAALVLGIAGPAAAIDPIYTGFLSDTAAGGYDPVAYFSEGKPVAGSAEHSHQWMGASWRFASAENKALFASDPERYAPQYGGYCAYAVANGATAPGDPEVWKIVDGKLYLNVSRGIQDEWQKDVPGYIRRADENWPALLRGN